MRAEEFPPAISDELLFNVAADAQIVFAGETAPEAEPVPKQTDPILRVLAAEFALYGPTGRRGHRWGD